MVATGWGVVVTHGNGPQVGFILLRSESVPEELPVPRLNLEMSVADSQGGIGHILGQALLNELAARGLPDRVACVLSHVVVDPADPAFSQPDQADRTVLLQGGVGPEGRAEWLDDDRGLRARLPPGRRLAGAAADRGGRHRSVPSSTPATSSSRSAAAASPWSRPRPASTAGVEAVIDKDRASALLAASLDIPLLVLSTGVERVAVHFRQPDERWVDQMAVDEARGYLEAGEFPKGSMGPKVEAAIRFLERGGQEVLITTPAALERAIGGETGTRIVPDPVQPRT